MCANAAISFITWDFVSLWDEAVVARVDKGSYMCRLCRPVLVKARVKRADNMVRRFLTAVAACSSS